MTYKFNIGDSLNIYKYKNCKLIYQKQRYVNTKKQ